MSDTVLGTESTSMNKKEKKRGHITFIEEGGGQKLSKWISKMSSMIDSDEVGKKNDGLWDVLQFEIWCLGKTLLNIFYLSKHLRGMRGWARWIPGRKTFQVRQKQI